MRQRHHGCTRGWIGTRGRAYLHVLQTILLSYTSQYILLATLLHFSGEQQLVEDEVGLLKVEDDV